MISPEAVRHPTPWRLQCPGHKTSRERSLLRRASSVVRDLSWSSCCFRCRSSSELYVSSCVRSRRSILSASFSVSNSSCNVTQVCQQLILQRHTSVSTTHPATSHKCVNNSSCNVTQVCQQLILQRHTSVSTTHPVTSHKCVNNSSCNVTQVSQQLIL